MYVDYPPIPNCPAMWVLVIEATDKPYTADFIDEVIGTAKTSAATSYDPDNDKIIFWIVFADEPKRLWDFTEKSLRSSLRRPKSERLSKEHLKAMGGAALIAEILETFDGEGNLGSYARKELPQACLKLEITTIGELAKLKRSEIAGPQACYTGNKTMSWIEGVLAEFGLQLRTV